jgi:predicted DNA binding CopG/RHH family protein
LEEVPEPVFERAAEITLRLEANEAQALREMAESRGVPDSELIRQWIHEKLGTSS